MLVWEEERVAFALFMYLLIYLAHAGFGMGGQSLRRPPGFAVRAPPMMNFL